MKFFSVKKVRSITLAEKEDLTSSRLFYSIEFKEASPIKDDDSFWARFTRMPIRTCVVNKVLAFMSENGEVRPPSSAIVQSINQLISYSSRISILTMTSSFLSLTSSLASSLSDGFTRDHEE